MSLDQIIQSKAFKDFLAKLYSIGASVVVIGALFKIQHWPGAGFFLSAGLITEAVIFFFYAFDNGEEPMPVYSEVVNYPEDELPEHHSFRGKHHGIESSGQSTLALVKFDELLENAEITPDLFLRLGDGMRKLGETTENLNTMGEISAASLQYMKTVKLADESLGRLAKTYETSILNVTCKTVFKYKNIEKSLSVIEEETKSYQKQMRTINKNLSDLNGYYRLQKEGMDDYLSDLSESLAESCRYREQMKMLNENLTALNHVYGNMLGAMKVK
jgi:gliding motility-associated protein GldL